MRQEKLSPSWWSNGPGDHYSAHSHAYNKVLFCAEGSITFRVDPEGLDYVLQAGDRLDIPRGTVHSAVVGSKGADLLRIAGRLIRPAGFGVH